MPMASLTVALRGDTGSLSFRTLPYPKRRADAFTGPLPCSTSLLWRLRPRYMWGRLLLQALPLWCQPQACPTPAAMCLAMQLLGCWAALCTCPEPHL